MNPSELKYHVANTGSNFFSQDSMRFFGDTMRNYGVRSASVVTSYDENDNYVENGLIVEAWELYRKHPVKCGLQKSAYFDKKTFARIYPKINPV